MPTPNPTNRREYKGAAAATTLQNSMTNADTTFVLIANTNWPTGAVGKFIVTINRGQADEEKILCDTQSTRTVACLLANRGFDGTAAQSHAAGATVECTISAFDADEWNQHTNATGAVHGVAGSVVGTTDAQTLTNKTLTSPTTSGVVTETGVHSPDTAAHVALTLKGLTSQSGPLLAATNVGGQTGSFLHVDGSLHYGNGAVTINNVAGFFSGGVGLVAVDPTQTPLIVRANATQSQPLIEVQNPAGNAALFKVDQSGNVSAANLTSAWTAYTPSFTNITGGAGTFAYNLVGKTLYIRGIFSAGTATAAGQVSISLPASLTSAVAGSSIVPGFIGTTNAPWSTSHATTMTTAGAAFTLGQSLVGLVFTGVIEVA